MKKAICHSLMSWLEKNKKSLCMNITFLINILLPELLCKATHWQWTSPGKSHLQTGHPKKVSHSRKAGPMPSVAPIMDREPCWDALECSVLASPLLVFISPSSLPHPWLGCRLCAAVHIIAGTFFCMFSGPQCITIRSDDSQGNYCPSKLPSSELGRRPCRTCLFRTHHFAPPLTVT